MLAALAEVGDGAAALLAVRRPSGRARPPKVGHAALSGPFRRGYPPVRRRRAEEEL
jgi:hypothetical protein